MRRSNGSYRDSSVDPLAQANGAMAERVPGELAGEGTGFRNLSPVVDDAAWMVAIEGDDAVHIGGFAHLEQLL